MKLQSVWSSFTLTYAILSEGLIWSLSLEERVTRCATKNNASLLHRYFAGGLDWQDRNDVNKISYFDSFQKDFKDRTDIDEMSYFDTYRTPQHFKDRNDVSSIFLTLTLSSWPPLQRLGLCRRNVSDGESVIPCNKSRVASGRWWEMQKQWEQWFW